MTYQCERPRTGESEAAVEDVSQRRHSTATSPSDQGPEAHNPDLPPGVVTLEQSLAELARILPGLKAALECTHRPAESAIAFRKGQAAKLLGISPRLVERLLAAGKFPRPDCHLGRCPVWTRATLERYVVGGGGQL
jgi:hypothetical protein